MYHFDEIITTEAEFRHIMGEPGARVLDKSITYLDQHSQNFIAHCPLLMLASHSASGQITVSPKGDPRGFVRALDKHTLLIPERPGNRRAETFKNILQHPSVGLLFMIPNKGETLRISGQARLVRDKKLREDAAIKGKVPDFMLAIHVQEVYFHCAKAMVRSKIWQTESWGDTSGLAKLGQMMVDAGGLKETAEQMQKIIDEDEKTSLY